jgi:hypothetical protein
VNDKRYTVTSLPDGAATNRLPKFANMQLQLPMGSLCGYPMPHALRERVLASGKSCNLLGLYFFLTNDRRSNPELIHILGSTTNIRRAKNAYLAFYKHILQTPARRSSSPKIAWVIPRKMLQENDYMTAEASNILLRHISELDNSWSADQISNSHKIWLPYLSLASINLIRRWRQPRLSALRRCIFKHMSTCHDSNVVDFFSTVDTNESPFLSIPLQVLYQYQPSRLLLTSISLLNQIGFCSLRDLRAIHPDSVQFVKDQRNRKMLLDLYRRLECYR